MNTTLGSRLRKILTIGAVTGALAAQTVTAADPKPAGPEALPLSRVVMFSSGVGFYEHAGQIEGTKQVELKFNVDDVNDLLKSLVLRDLNGGKISTVTYASRDPITRTLKTFAIDLTTNPTLANLLDQVRGEKVEIEVVGGEPVQGTILGIERRKQPQEKQVIEVEYLNLVTDRGLKSFPLASAVGVKLLNESLDRELRQALVVLAMGHSTDKKAVTLNFVGEGKRAVRVGYIQQSPIWKTSYRLVLDDQKKPYLQGWALVENVSETDWKDVSLTLVSGRPISFVMDLYQPLYVPRPNVELELFASLRPQRYGQDLAKNEQEFAARHAGNRDKDAYGRRMERLAENQAAKKQPAGAAGAVPASPAYARAASELSLDSLGREPNADQGYFAYLGDSVNSAASAGNVGELFQYVIDTPVNLPRQQSAMLPIVQEDVQGEKVSIYNAGVHPKHPLNGLRLKNSTKLHLMQGPITVFDGNAYAGDAQIDDIAPGSERLISYAMDLDTEVAIDTPATPEALVSVRLVKGTIIAGRKYVRTQIYTVKNSGARTKTVLIEQPRDDQWKLITPSKPDEQTRDKNRYAVKAEPGVPVKLTVTEEMVMEQHFAASNVDDNTIQFYLKAKVISESVKAKLAELIERKQAIAQASHQLQVVSGEIQTIGSEQSRIRQNMQQLDRQSPVYARYVKMFSEQEDRIAQLRISETKLREELQKLQVSLDQFMLMMDAT
ncbi:MAG: hypothetical protein JSS27_07340 [Planctomycetes bacterium]|nr:hypothetical protein [Planctomycetota bacterium]